MSKSTILKPGLLRWISILCIVFADILVVSCNWTLSDEVDKVSEYEVKAAFLLNFVRFTDWSERTRGETESALVLGILGEDHFGEALNLIRDKKIKGRVLVVKRGVDSNNLTECDILFISSSEKDRLSSIMAAVKDLPILTVSEIEGFNRSGGMINFIIVGNKVRFEINPDAAKQAGIHISAQLLQLARIVTGD